MCKYKPVERKTIRVSHLFVSWNVTKLPAAEDSSYLLQELEDQFV